LKKWYFIQWFWCEYNNENIVFKKGTLILRLKNLKNFMIFCKN
jgi:hypothetical protein